MVIQCEDRNCWFLQVKMGRVYHENPPQKFQQGSYGQGSYGQGGFGSGGFGGRGGGRCAACLLCVS